MEACVSDTNLKSLLRPNQRHRNEREAREGAHIVVVEVLQRSILTPRHLVTLRSAVGRTSLDARASIVVVGIGVSSPLSMSTPSSSSAALSSSPRACALTNESS